MYIGVTAGTSNNYLHGPKGRSGELRKAIPLNNGRALIDNALQAQMPLTAKLNTASKRTFMKERVLHIYTGFSEWPGQVSLIFPTLIDTVKAVVAAGMPPWTLLSNDVEHDHEHHTHFHLAMLNSMLPGLGDYQSPPLKKLLFLTARLLSYKFNLSDPLDSARARKFHPGPYSSSVKTKPFVEEVVDWFWSSEGNVSIPNHKKFMELLKANYDVVAMPCKGEPRNNSQGIREYPGLVGLRYRGKVVYFGGPIVRLNYTLKEFMKTCSLRAEDCMWLKVQGPNRLYEDFLELFKRRMEIQNEMFRRRAAMFPNVLPAEYKCVTEEFVKWLSRRNDDDFVFEMESFEDPSESQNSFPFVPGKLTRYLPPQEYPFVDYCHEIWHSDREFGYAFQIPDPFTGHDVEFLEETHAGSCPRKHSMITITASATSETTSSIQPPSAEEMQSSTAGEPNITSTPAAMALPAPIAPVAAAQSSVAESSVKEVVSRKVRHWLKNYVPPSFIVHKKEKKKPFGFDL